jgi:hypothetical protein
LLQKQIRVEHFVKLIQEVAETLLKYDCPINALPELTAEKQVELIGLEQTIESLKSSKIEINDYSRDKPLVDTIKGIREEIRDLKGEAILDKNQIVMLECKWHVGRFIPENMTSEEVEEAAQLLLYNAVELIEAIKYIQKKAPSLPYTTTGPRFTNQGP